MYLDMWTSDSIAWMAKIINDYGWHFEMSMVIIISNIGNLKGALSNNLDIFWTHDCPKFAMEFNMFEIDTSDYLGELLFSILEWFDSKIKCDFCW